MTAVKLAHWFFALLLCAGPIWGISPYAGVVAIGLITWGMDYIYIPKSPIMSIVGVTILAWCVVAYPMALVLMWGQWISGILG